MNEAKIMILEDEAIVADDILLAWNKPVILCLQSAVQENN